MFHDEIRKTRNVGKSRGELSRQRSYGCHVMRRKRFKQIHPQELDPQIQQGKAVPDKSTVDSRWKACRGSTRRDEVFGSIDWQGRHRGASWICPLSRKRSGGRGCLTPLYIIILESIIRKDRGTVLLSGGASVRGTSVRGTGLLTLVI